MQSVLRVPVQKLRTLNGTETERHFLFCSFLLHLRAKVLQLQLSNAVSTLEALRLPTTKQKNQQNLWWLAMCVMYYVRSRAQNENKAGCCMETAWKLPFCCTTDNCKLFYDILYTIQAKS